MGIEIKFYNLDTFKKQVDANCIDLDSEFVDLNYKVASLIFCHFWRSIETMSDLENCQLLSKFCNRQHKGQWYYQGRQQQGDH